MAKLSNLSTTQLGASVGVQQTVITVQAQKLGSLILSDDKLALDLARKAAREIRLSAQRIERALRDEHGRRFMAGT